MAQMESLLLWRWWQGEKGKREGCSEAFFVGILGRIPVPGICPPRVEFYGNNNVGAHAASGSIPRDVTTHEPSRTAWGGYSGLWVSDLQLI